MSRLIALPQLASDCYVKISQPIVKYGTVFKPQCTFLYSIVAHYPGHAIYLYDNDISGAFPQQVFNPSVAKNKVGVHERVIILTVALHFGQKFGPAIWKPVGNARCFIAEWLYKHYTYQTGLNRVSLNMVSFPKDTLISNFKERFIIKPIIDKYTLPVKPNETFIPQVKLFVNNLLTAGPKQLMITAAT